MNNFPETAQAIRRRKNIAIRELARRMHVNHSQISRPLSGKTSIKRDWLIDFCRALDCTPEEIAEIFASTDYRAPTLEELEEEPVAA